VLGTRIPGYDPTEDAISRLAADGAPDAGWMTAGFVAFGVGVPLFGLVLRDALEGPAWTTAVATGVATLGVAALPLDGWAPDGAHNLAAGIGYLTLAATPLLAAPHLPRRAALASRLIGAASLAALALTPFVDRSGLAQRVGLTLGDVWLVTTAAALVTGRYGRRA
jgi:hypothetical protein